MKTIPNHHQRKDKNVLFFVIISIILVVIVAAYTSDYRYKKMIQEAKKELLNRNI